MFVPEVVREDPGTFHARPFDGDLSPNEPSSGALWVPQLDANKTLVLGSSQKPDTVDANHLGSAGINIAKRRSGGGAVLVSSEDVIWFDIVLDKTHRHWNPDVTESFEWLGRACHRGLQQLDIETTMHTGRLNAHQWSRVICFAGLGPGELTHAGRKVVGMSQRRTRNRARFQVAILRRWSGAEHANFLSEVELERAGKTRAEASAELQKVAAGVPNPPSDVLESIFKEL